MGKDGYKIVLTSNRTLMSDYHGGIFLGFSACFPTSLIRESLYFRLFCPSTETNKDGSVKIAPRSVRLIESSLIKKGFDPSDIVIAHPSYLDKLIGPNTEIVGISEMDPLGIGPATSTFTQIFGGEAYMSVKFKEILNNPSIKKHNPKIVVGGSGAWQLNLEGNREKFEVDTVMIGESEGEVGDVFNSILDGNVPKLVGSGPAEINEIPEMYGPTMNGIVEISRGCGRGCDFCSLSQVKRRDLSFNQIYKDITTNLSAGIETPLLHAEDVLKYKSDGLNINVEEVTDLFKKVKKIPGVRFVDISHFQVSSIVSAPEVIENIKNVLNLGGKQKFIGGQIGIETGSPKLIEKHMKGKVLPYSPAKWPDMVVESFKTLSENNWVAAGTVLMGLPGETEDDVRKTIELIENLKDYRSLIVPLSYVSPETGKSFNIMDAPECYTELFKKSWEHNFRWMDSLYNDYSKMYINKLARLPVKYVLKFAKHWYKNKLNNLLDEE